MRMSAGLLNMANPSGLRRRRKTINAATLGLIALGPALAVWSFLALGTFDLTGPGETGMSFRVVLLVDIVYVVALAAMVLQRVVRMVAARRARSAGSRLHLRLTVVFACVALMPTVLVAAFAGLTVNIALEGWFSERVRQVVANSLSAAEAYEKEHRDGLIEDALALARFLDRSRAQTFFVSDGELRRLLGQGQARIQRGLREAYVIDGAGEIRARGERSYLFDYEPPDAGRIAMVREGGTEVIEDWSNGEFRALVALDAFPDRFLLVSREVDGDILELLDETAETVAFYNRLERDRGRILFEFALLYLGFAVILILAAVWMGLWFAERLSRPVGRLAGAAQKVGDGDLDARVREESGDDEIAMLGRIFNRMTRQLKVQRDELLENHAQTERRRRLFDSVLSSVTAGVVGIEPDGRVAFVNRSARKLLDLADESHAPLGEAVPEFATLFERLKASGREVAQKEIKMTRRGKQENLLVRMATRRAENGALEGYVVALDDVTDLVSAQRMAAWGDIARRIAHEIKNPLTPIRLSAERLELKFARALGKEDAAALAQMTGVIVRQTDDLRRIVDEFSKFARMPAPELGEIDLAEIVRDAVALQEAGSEGIAFSAELPAEPVIVEGDAAMLGQALTNLIKNAREAVESRNEESEERAPGEVRVEMLVDGRQVAVAISDNGVGLPEDRSGLFEPYVTTRSSGTGLGLPIVKKIVEEHGGDLVLTDADPFAPGARAGARAEIRMPLRMAAEDAADSKSSV